jgi:ankyrin repeat protein
MWQASPIFISSTFVDMQAERDFLRSRVFPELEERLASRRHNLEWVDLRVGVATASEHDERVRELYVLKVCLDEVRRCRPYLIVLLGDRYGWVPPEDRIKSAAEEAREGFSANIVGRSVTELEIEFGILSDSDQQARSFFYFREPLPYAGMPAETARLYSEDYTVDAGKESRKNNLAALKDRIEKQLPARVRRYSGTWDSERQCVAGLEEFGRMVLDDLWSELDRATKAFEAVADAPWRQAESEALQDFFEDRARDFVGRDSVIDTLNAFATAGDAASGAWGVCVTGDPGSGKSALAGELYRRLRASKVFLLAHSAGSSVNAASVDSMLRRWIGELADALGVDPGIPESADPALIEATFSRLLSQMAQQQPVVVLIDALDQFENTTRGRYASWLPRTWPVNARLVTTAIAGDASKALAERGLQIVSLAPLDANSAREIIVGICRRYHRAFEPAVADAVMAKRGADGPAWGNPLWLVLAVEDLNLLDSDDFAHAQRSYAGEPAERLRAFLVDTVAVYPIDIAGLYNHTFARAEEAFGANLTRGFLGLIAVSRAGWRESDFRTLLPQVSGDSWDELQFAQLRRFFRGQLRQRGARTRWDFNHAQMRIAARQRLGSHDVSLTDLHGRIVTYLRSLGAEDPLRQSETMYHLLESGDYKRAVEYFGDRALPEPEVRAALQILMDSVLRAPDGDQIAATRRLLNLLSAPGANPAAVKHATVHFLFELGPALKDRAISAARIVLATGVHETLSHLLEADPTVDPDLRVYLVCSDLNLAELQREGGDVSAAERTFQMIVEKVGRVGDDKLGSDLISLISGAEGIGDSQFSRGDYPKAETSFRLALATFQRYEDKRAASDADTQAILQRLQDKRHTDFDKMKEAVARFSASATANLDKMRATLLTKLGDALLAQERFSEAGDLYGAAQAIYEHYAALNPTSALQLREVVVIRNKLGNMQAASGDTAKADGTFRAMLDLAEKLHDADPSNMEWQHDLSVAYYKLADVCLMRDDKPQALQLHQKSAGLREDLIRRDPQNADWRTSLALSRKRLATLQPSSAAPASKTDADIIDLINAIQRDDLVSVRAAISRGIDPTKGASPDGPTPFGYAIAKGSANIFRFILESGVNPNVGVGGGSNALSLAADRGRAEIAQMLLAAGAAVDAEESDGRTALVWAAERGDNDIVTLLLDRGADINHVVRANGATALHAATQKEHETTVALLLSRGARVDLATSGGNTALHFAAFAGNEKIVSLLVTHGADSALVNSQGKTAHDIAREQGKDDELFAKTKLTTYDTLKKTFSEQRPALHDPFLTEVLWTVYRQPDPPVPLTLSYENAPHYDVVATFNKQEGGIKSTIEVSDNTDGRPMHSSETRYSLIDGKWEAEILRNWQR